MFGTPKYYASLVRARRYARRTQQILLWNVAKGTPINNEHTNLTPEELDTKREEWAMYHDQKTGGNMGYLPLLKNMPMRITHTDHKKQERRL